MGQPERPALAPFPVLGALAATLDGPASRGGGPFLGTLVARVGLVPNDVLVASSSRSSTWRPGRVIAGLGTGDRLSEAENRAYGIPFAAGGRAARRHGRAGRAPCGRRASPVWVAGGPAARTDEARAAGAALNLWDAEPALVAERCAGPTAVEVTWAGPAADGRAAAARARAASWPRPAPPGPSSAGPSTSTTWSPRPREAPRS